MEEFIIIDYNVVLKFGSIKIMMITGAKGGVKMSVRQWLK